MPGSFVPTNTECGQCGREFLTRHRGQRFCSVSCAARRPRPNARRAIGQKTCACGTTFEPSAPRVRFCSRACVTRFGGVLRTKACPHCLATYETKSAIQVYCSLRCQRLALLERSVRHCENCDSEYKSLDCRRRYCSVQCARVRGRRYRGADAPNWKGGRTLAAGYVRRRAPSHPRTTPRNPYVLEHILVMERLLGRYLAPNERVHHRNGRRDDNRLENLELWKMKDPPGVRASDYHCAGCTCDRQAMLGAGNET